jgi:repressor LexA
MKLEGMPPTNREIGQAMQIASTGHVDYHLTMLEKKRLIERQPKKSRGIKLVDPSVLSTATPPDPGIVIKGAIAAGQPLDVYSDEEYQMLPLNSHLTEGENCYALMVKGYSMIEDHICDGDYVVVKPQKICQNGDIVVAIHMQEGVSGSVTLKRFFQEKEHDRVRLQPANSTLDPILISRSTWDREWEVQGKVVAIFRQCGGLAA